MITTEKRTTISQTKQDLKFLEFLIKKFKENTSQVYRRALESFYNLEKNKSI
jgi:hypothetical protein